MQKWKNNKLKRILAGILALILTIVSIPVSNFVVNKVKAGNDVQAAELYSNTEEYCDWKVKVIDSTDENLGIIGATVSAVAMEKSADGSQDQAYKDDSSNSVQFSLTTDTNGEARLKKAEYETLKNTLSNDGDYIKFTAAETNGYNYSDAANSSGNNVITKAGEEFDIPENGVAITMDGMVEVNAYINSGLTYESGESGAVEQALISKFPEVVSTSNQEASSYNVSAAVADTYEVPEDSSNNWHTSIGENDNWHKKTDAGEYYVFVKVSNADSSSTITKIYPVSISKATISDEDFTFGEDSEKSVEWNKEDIQYIPQYSDDFETKYNPDNKEKTVEYTIAKSNNENEEEVNKPAIDNDGKITFRAANVGSTYTVTAKLNLTNYYGTCSYNITAEKGTLSNEKVKLFHDTNSEYTDDELTSVPWKKSVKISIPALNNDTTASVKYTIYKRNGSDYGVVNADDTSVSISGSEVSFKPEGVLTDGAFNSYKIDAQLTEDSDYYKKTADDSIVGSVEFTLGKASDFEFAFDEDINGETIELPWNTQNANKTVNKIEGFSEDKQPVTYSISSSDSVLDGTTINSKTGEIKFESSCVGKTYTVTATMDENALYDSNGKTAYYSIEVTAASFDEFKFDDISEDSISIEWKKISVSHSASIPEKYKDVSGITVEYEISKKSGNNTGSLAVSTNGEVTGFSKECIGNIYTVTAILSGTGYEDKKVTYDIEVTKAELNSSDYYFNLGTEDNNGSSFENPIENVAWSSDISLADVKTGTNIESNDGSAVSYIIEKVTKTDATEIAENDINAKIENNKIVFGKECVGSVYKVTAKRTGSSYYKDAECSYYIKPGKAALTGFAFKNIAADNSETNPLKVEWNSEVKYIASTDEVEGINVSYSIEKCDTNTVKSDSKPSVADDGLVHFDGVNIGNVYKVTATAQESQYYNASSCSYYVSPTKASVSDFAFEGDALNAGTKDNALSIGWDKTDEIYTAATGTPLYGNSQVQYTISTEDGQSLASNEISVDSSTGKLAFSKNSIGKTYKVTAELTADYYDNAEAVYYIKVDKADSAHLSFSLTNDTLYKNYNMYLQKADTSDEDTDESSVKYSITKNKSNVNVEINEDNGLITLKDGTTADNYNNSSIEVTAEKAANEYYNKKAVTYTLSFSATDVPLYNVDSESKKHIEGSEWYYTNVKLNALDKDGISLNRDKFTTDITFNETQTNTQVYCIKGNIEYGFVYSCKIDKAAPEISDAAVTGARYTVDKDNVITTYYGTAKNSDGNNLSVSFTVKDNNSEIADIKCYSVTEKEEKELSYTEKVGSTNTEKTVIVNVPEEFTGKIKISTKDNAGNKSEKESVTVITDDTAPIIKDLKAEKDAEKSVVVTFNVEELNFDSADVKIKTELQKFNETQYSVIAENDSFIWNEKNASKTFEEEGNYRVTVSYKDKSGNNSEEKSVEFTVDKTAPTLNVKAYYMEKGEEKEINNSGIVQSSPYLKITINDAGDNVNGYKADRVNVDVKCFNANNENIEQLSEKIKEALSKNENWSKITTGVDAGSWVFEKELKTLLSEEDSDVRYLFNISYVDGQSNQSNGEISFIRDCKAPEVSMTYSVSKENIIEKVINNITKWFFPNVDDNNNKKDLKVTVNAVDEMTDIREIWYKTANDTEYKKADKLSHAEKDNNRQASFTFEINENHDGVLYAYALDSAGNKTEVKSEGKNEAQQSYEVSIVRDTEKPQMQVEYSSEHAAFNDNYYDGNVTMNIEVDEKYFDKENLYVNVKYTPFNEAESDMSSTVKTYLNAADHSWTNSGIKNTNSYVFENDGKYDVKLYYKDYSGNTTETLTKTFYIDTVAPEIKVTLKDKNKTEVDGNNGYNTDGKVQADIEITEAGTFDTSDIEWNLVVKDGSQNIVYDSSNDKDYEDTKYDQFRKIGSDIRNGWVQDKSSHTKETINFPDDYYYEFKITYKDKVGKTAEVTKSFTSAVTKPEIIGIACDTDKYDQESKPGIIFFDKSVKNVVIYVKAYDYASGIDRFEYTIEGKPAGEINEADIEKDGQNNYYLISIPIEFTEQYRGKLTIKAINKAGVSSDVKTVEIVIDSKAAVLESSYDKKNVITENNADTINYNDTVTGKYTIDEANFYKEDAKLTVKYTPFNGSEVTELESNDVPWVFNNNKYEYSREFNKEGKYTVELNYKDKSNNESTLIDTFFIDKTKPEVDIDAVNNNHYNADTNVTFKVTEANFYKEDVKLTAKYTPYHGSEQDISSKIKDELDKDWKQDLSNNSIRTSSYNFTDEGTYVIVMSYKDKSGNDVQEISRTFTIDKTAPVMDITLTDSDGNAVIDGQYSHKEVTASIRIIEAGEFNPSDVELVVSAKNSADIENVLFLKNNFAEIVKNSDNWESKNSPDEHICTFNIPEEYQYNFQLNYTDVTGWNAETVSRNFVYDKTNPENLDISYSSNERNNKVIDGENYIFFKNNVDKITVTLTAVDKTSKVDYFEYSLDNGLSYNRLDNLTYDGTKATATFDIEAQYKGKILYRAVDKGSLDTDADDGNIIVIDTIAPKLTVDYVSGGNAVNNTYYNADRKAVITIEEKNFYPENVNLVINRTLNDDVLSQVQDAYLNGYNEHDISKGPWKYIGDDKYQCEVNFNEDADYSYTMTVSDYSGQSDTKEDAFTIDKINPVINVTYYNNDARNGNQFKADRTAQIVVTEHNFNAEYVNAVVTALDKNNALVQTIDYTSYLKDISNWTKSGNTYTAYITFSSEANYTFDISCYDMAGRYNDDESGQRFVNWGESVAPTEFTVDKTNPTGLIRIGNWTQSKNGSVWDHLQESTTFGLWTDSAVNVEFTNDDNLSNVEYMKFYKTDKPLTPAQLYDLPESSWVDVNTFTVQPDERFIIYARVMDRAGNEVFISSDGVIVDRTQPTGGDETAPKVVVTTTDTNDIYNTDVSYNIYTLDPATGSGADVFSGIRTIEYAVINHSTGTTTQEETLYSFNVENPSLDELLKEWSGSIVVDSSLNNSNNVDVYLTVTDNAGNVSTVTKNIKIDITDPVISVTYDNNNGDTSFGENTYFNADRTATIDITERNFDENNVEVLLTDTNGINPSISGWTRIAGSSDNEDDTIYRTNVVFDTDSDYTFDINFRDMVGNTASKDGIYGDSLAPQQFTIDKTVPVISVTYDNNDAVNGNYYKQARTATVSIEEHNFETSRVVSSISADGGTGSAPSISDWSTNGDTNTATVTYSGDTLYTFALQYTDMAGNEAVAYENDSFYVDVTIPELEITNVSDQSAYKDDVVAPAVVFSDTYYDSVDIKLSGSRTGAQTIDSMGSYSLSETGGSFTFNNIETDDIYTLSASVLDKAGNSIDASVTFSVNRNGSTYEMSPETQSLNGSYVTQVNDIIMYEVNPDELVKHTVTLFKNNKTITLIEGQDYEVSLTGGSGDWYRYEYRLFANNFVDDGVYRVSIMSEDKAGNIAQNTIDTKNEELSFVVDKTMPTIIALNLERGTTYAIDSMVALLNINDNMKLNRVEVYLDNVLVNTWDAEQIKQILDNNEDFAVNIGSSNEARVLRVVVTDAAGNVAEEIIDGFYVTTNLFIRYYTNKTLFYGSIAGMIVVIGAVVSLIVFRRKRKVTKSNNE